MWPSLYWQESWILLRATFIKCIQYLSTFIKCIQYLSDTLLQDTHLFHEKCFYTITLDKITMQLVIGNFPTALHLHLWFASLFLLLNCFRFEFDKMEINQCRCTFHQQSLQSICSNWVEACEREPNWNKESCIFYFDLRVICWHCAKKFSVTNSKIWLFNLINVPLPFLTLTPDWASWEWHHD